MIAQVDSDGAGFIVGADGNDIFYGSGQLSYDTNSGAINATVAGQGHTFFDTTYSKIYALDAQDQLSVTAVATNDATIVTSIDLNADNTVDDIQLDLLGLNGSQDGAEIGLLDPTSTTTTPTPTTDTIARTLEDARYAFAIEDEFIVNATELRTLTGAQGNGETWGGARILEISQSALADWYNSSSADYAGQLASGTVDNTTVDSGLNGWAVNYDVVDSDTYDGLGILPGWNDGETTSFASYGSGGTGETAPVVDPEFDYFVDLPVTFDPDVPVEVTTGPVFTYIAPPPSVDPYVFDGIDYDPYDISDYDPYDYFLPIVFDLDGDGVELIDQQDSHAYFDVKGDGLGNRYNVGWVGADDGMLAIDKNNDGLINQADELSFARWTADQTDTDMDGLKAVFDTNHNGLLDSGDARFADMRVWRDLNGDGVSDAGELQTLTAAGIASLNLSPARTNWARGGNQINGFSTYQRSNGVLGWAGDVGLGYQADGWKATTLTNFVKITQSGGLTYGLSTTGAALVLDLGVQEMDGAVGSAAGDALSAGTRSAVLLEGGLGNDWLTGGAGDDWLNGGLGADVLSGGPGDDTIIIDAQDAYVNGGAGIDIAMVSGTGSTDVASAIETGAPAVGGSWLSKLIKAVVAAASGGLNTAPSPGYGIAGQSGGVRLDLGATGFEAAVGSDGNDSFFTSATGRVILAGEGGNDQLAGGANSDMLDGGAGNDTLRGGNGNDVYVFGRGDGTDEVLDSATRSQTTESSYETITATRVRKVTPWQMNPGTYDVLRTLRLMNPELRQPHVEIERISTSGNLICVYYIETIYTRTQHNTTITEEFAIDAGLDTLRLGTGIDSTDLEVELVGSDLFVEVISATPDGAASLGRDVVVIRNQTSQMNALEAIQFEDGKTENTVDWRYGGGGADTLIGDSSANHLFGAGGNDVLSGELGEDTLTGGTGDDFYIVDSSGDVVVERLNGGFDRVVSYANFTLAEQVEDLLLLGTVSINATGNSQNNFISGNVGNNLIDGGQGADTMEGAEGDDTYVVDNTADTITENLNEGNDTVLSAVTFALVANVENLTLTGTGNWNATGNAMTNVVTGNSGSNAIDGGLGADTLAGGAGNDSYTVDDLNDVVQEAALGGDDTVYTYAAGYTLGANVENLTLLGGMNAVSGYGNELNNRIYGNSLANNLSGYAGNDLLSGGAGADTLTGGAGDDVYIVADAGDLVVELSGEGRDAIHATVNVDLRGSANVENVKLDGVASLNATGNELANLLDGNAGANILDGGAGNDIMSGGTGNDTYVFGRGYGVDQIYDEDATVGNADTLHMFAGVASSSLTLSRDPANGDLVISINGTADVVRVAKWFLGAPYRVERITFADEATVWNATTIMQMAVVRGTAASENLYGDEGNNTYESLGGDDFLSGAEGNDTYLFGPGSGQDTVLDLDITANNIDTLRLTGGLAPSGVTLSRATNLLDLHVTITATGERAVLMNWFYEPAYRIERIEFASGGSVWDATYILNAVRFGTAGNDTLLGDAGDNVLDGGVGADVLMGGAGNDTYAVENPYDNVVENTAAGTDSVHSSLTYTLGANLENLVLIGLDPINGTGNTLNNHLTGNAASNALNGSVGADTLTGGAGDDVYTVDASGDVVEEDAEAGWDVVYSTVNYTLGSNVEDLALLAGAAVSGTGNALNNRIYGNAQNNTLTGGSGNDRLDGQSGGDSMLGGTGNDDYFFDHSGDVAIELTGEGVDRIYAQVSINVAAMTGIENVYLTASGNINATGNALDNALEGNSGANSLVGAAGNDMLGGWDGADTLDGGTGNDYLFGGLGADTYVFGRGSGYDTITEEAESGVVDTLQLALGVAPGDVVLSRVDDNLSVTIKGTTDQLTIWNWFSGTNTQVERIAFTDGTIWDTSVLQSAKFLGTFADDTLVGVSGNDTLEGLGGNDQLVGQEGNDTYLFGRGYGQDVIFDSDAGLNTDTLRFLTGVLPSDVMLSRVADDLVLSIIGTMDEVRISSWFWDSAFRIEQVAFADGTVWGTSILQAAVVRGSVGADVLSGDEQRNTLDGLTGDDSLMGAAGNDLYLFGRGYGSDVVMDWDTTVGNVDTLRLLANVRPADVTLSRTLEDLVIKINGTTDQVRLQDWFADPAGRIERIEFADGTVWDSTYLQGTNLFLGTDGDDSIVGAETGNVLDAGAGTDLLLGQAGNDVYIFGRGYGHDTVIDGDLAVGNFDTIKLLAGILPEDVLLQRDANDLVLMITGTHDQLTVKGWFIESASRVERIEFANGVQWDSAVFAVIPLRGGAGNDSLAGGAEADNLMGGAGNDTLAGLGGDDVMLGDAGSDQMWGGLGDDFYVVDDVGDLVVEFASEGIDSVRSDISYVLAAEVENLTLGLTTAITGTGNALDNFLVGNAASNGLSGGAGADVLDGGAGADTLVGGAGDDSYIVDNVGDTVIELINEGTDTVTSSLTFVLGANIENLVLAGTAAVNGTGNALNNYLAGNSGANLLAGGLGDDTYLVDAVDVVNELTGEGLDTVIVETSYTLGANLESLVLAGSAAINGTGNSLNNALTGNSAANTLTGGAGADSMTGYLGDDVYWVDSAGDVVVEYAAEGIDTVNVSVSYVLGANLETLVGSGSTGLSLSGNESDNTISGTAFDDVLEGLAGNDLLNGNGGTDIASYSSALSAVSVDLGLTNPQVTGGAGTDTLTSIENLRGSNFNDTLTGNGANNVLDGGYGVDTLAGGAGNDTYYIENSADVVTELAGAGIDTVFSSVTRTLGVNQENLTLTTVAAINATGNDLNNLLAGNTANNALDGKLGADSMSGGAGDDTYYIDNAGDVVSELGNEGSDSVHAYVSYVLGANIESGYARADTAMNLTGNDLVNILFAGKGNNVIDGGLGADTVSYNGGGLTSGAVTVSLAVAGVQVTGGSGSDTLLNIENLSGSGFNDVLAGNAGNNVINGLIGADTMSGGAGDDTYYVDNVADVVTELVGEGTGDLVYSSITWTLAANTEKLILNGSAAINGTGNSLNNDVRGNANTAANVLTGGLGNDSYWVGVGDSVVEFVGEGTDLVYAYADYTLSANTENMTGQAAIGMRLGGNDLANSITGTAYNDTIEGGAGNDTLAGGVGEDTLSYATATAAVTANLTVTVAQNTGGAATDVLSGFEHLNGSAFNDTLTGSTGNNAIDGGAGADSMTGGAGDDTYTVDNTGDMITELASAGTDTVVSSVTYTLGATLENLTLGGATAINATGNALNNVLTGNSANNSLNGSAGADSMLGGLGNDTYYVDDAGDTVTELANEGTDTIYNYLSYTLLDNFENIRILATGAVNATGNSLNNALYAGEGNNILDGAAGADSAFYSYATAGVSVSLAIAGAQVTGSSGSDTLLNIENLTGSNFNDVLTGSSLGNVLNGLVGSDTMVGGLGDDVYYVDNAADVVTELAGEGADMVYNYLNYTLGTNLENVRVLATGAVNATGNSASNVVYAGDGNNVLDGATGTDAASYAFATSGVTVSLGTTVAQATGGSGSDTLLNFENLNGSAFNDALTGDGLANSINGSGGNDTLTGGAGNDTLTGGAGNDTYVFDRGHGVDSVAENDTTAGNSDIALFGAAIARDQLWFRQVGNNLEVSIIGTTDKFSVSNWYLGSQYHVELFKTSDGKTLTDGNVQSLVGAMAAFSPPTAGQTTLPATYATTLSPVIAANWQ